MTDKTIRMPKELLAKWLAALRSGGYVKCTAKLYDKKEGAFCCLGVLQHVVSGGCVEYDDDTGKVRTLPSQSWLLENDIQFWGGAGWASSSPFLPKYGKSAAMCNDTGKTFAEIADAIEACAEGV